LTSLKSVLTCETAIRFQPAFDGYHLLYLIDIFIEPDADASQHCCTEILAVLEMVMADHRNSQYICYDLAIGANGYPWVISADNTLSHYTGQWENIEAPTNLVELYEDVVDHLSEIHVSPTGELWITGLFHISNVNLAQNTWNLYALPEREGAITAFAFSASGTPWVAHLYKGKTSFRAFNGTYWPVIMQSGYEGGLDMTFDTAITDPNGAIWFIGEECFIRIMQHSWTVFNDAHAAWNPIYNHGVFSADGTLYFSAAEGILALGENRGDVSPSVTIMLGQLLSII